MKTVEVNSCYGSSKKPVTMQLAVTPSTGATVVSVFEGIDGNNVFLSPTDVLIVRDWFDERVRRLVFEGQLSEHLGD